MNRTTQTLNKQNNYLLILQTAFIGDVTLSLFFAEELKQVFPDKKIIFVTTKISAPIVKCAKAIDEVIVFDKRKSHKKIKDMKKLANEINEKFEIDIIFSLHRSMRSTLFAKFINAKKRVGFNNAAFSFLYDTKIKYAKNLHEKDRNHAFLTIFNNVSNNKQKKIKNVEIAISNQDVKTTERLLENLPTNKKNITIAIGSVWNTKRWSVDYFKILAEKLLEANYNVIFIGSEAERTESETIANLTGAHSLTGKTTLPQTLQIIKNSVLLITNDSAPTHFASILNVPTLTIFGPTSPIFGFAPLADFSEVAEDKELFCRPCSIHGEKKCPRKNHMCMNNITPEFIYNLAMSILEKCKKQEEILPN